MSNRSTASDHQTSTNTDPAGPIRHFLGLDILYAMPNSTLHTHLHSSNASGGGPPFTGNPAGDRSECSNKYDTILGSAGVSSHPAQLSDSPVRPNAAPPGVLRPMCRALAGDNWKNGEGEPPALQFDRCRDETVTSIVTKNIPTAGQRLWNFSQGREC
jgi:hypothetical protein